MSSISYKIFKFNGDDFKIIFEEITIIFEEIPTSIVVKVEA